MGFSRSSGILLHPTSLPGRFGIGDMGDSAYQFVDFLSECYQRIWQILPLGPTGYGDSPYQCFSAFAGNPLLIDLRGLVREGLLSESDLEGAPPFPEDSVDYGPVMEFKMSLLRRSFGNFKARASETPRGEFEGFCRRNSQWLDDYTLFMSLKGINGGAVWNTWDRDIASRRKSAIEHWTGELADEILFYKYLQWQFFKQWTALKRYANEKGIKIVGDIPIFVAYDSADVWSNPDLFYLDEEGRPTVVAGVPPDYFSEAGQLWGNPLYRWDVMAQRGYSWWIDRFKTTLTTVDIVRLDHFRGFEAYWEIPASETTAIKGRWVKGPGDKFFEAVRNALGELPIIAEDLGVITPEVKALRDGFGFPGMKILQFAFGSDAENEYLPHNFTSNCVVYTGTHDNDTVVGWFTGEGTRDSTRSQEEIEREREYALKYLGTDGSQINWDFIRLAFASVADTAIVPLQDVLGLGSEARMNLPGSPSGNWRWRFTFDMLTGEIKDRLREMTLIYGRHPADSSVKPGCVA
ncbi:MAG: 4-alpha-glucanotransferase [bacterium]